MSTVRFDCVVEHSFLALNFMFLIIAEVVFDELRLSRSAKCFHHFLAICAKGDYNLAIATLMLYLTPHFLSGRSYSPFSREDSYFVSQDVSPDVTDITEHSPSSMKNQYSRVTTTTTQTSSFLFNFYRNFLAYLY